MLALIPVGVKVYLVGSRRDRAAFCGRGWGLKRVFLYIVVAVAVPLRNVKGRGFETPDTGLYLTKNGEFNVPYFIVTC